MEQALLYIGLITSALMLVKLVMMTIGGEFGGDADSDIDLGHGDLDGASDVHSHLGEDIQIISVFTMLVFLMIGSWAGWGVMNAFHLSEELSGLVALGAGVVGMYGTAWTMMRMKRLQSDGTIRNFDPKGYRGEVYMRIPPAGEGEGQVRLTVNGRLKEFRAVSDGDEAIESFTAVEVLNMTSDHVMLVRKTG